MMESNRTVYQINRDGIFTGVSRQIGPKEPRSADWAASDAPPPAGIAQWTGSGWRVLSQMPAPSVSPELNEALNAERLRRIEAGKAFAVTGVSGLIPLQGRPFDQTVYLALLNRASAIKAAGVSGPVMKVRAADNVIYNLTPDQMIELVSKSMQWFEAVMATSWAMKDATGAFPNGIPLDFTNDGYWP